MTKETDLLGERISKAFRDPIGLTKTLQSGINAALMQHKHAGNPVCEWKGGKVVWVAPENILESKTDQE